MSKISYNKRIEKGGIYWVVLPNTGGSVQHGLRPVIITQNNKGNQFSPNVTVVPITSKNKKWMPTHVDLSSEFIVALPKDSIALCESPITISKELLGDYIDCVGLDTLEKIDDALMIQLDLGDTQKVKRIKDGAKEYLDKINYYKNVIKDFGSFLDENIVDQTRIRIKLEQKRLEEYCMRYRLNIRDYIEEENVRSYTHIDRKVIAM